MNFTGWRRHMHQHLHALGELADYMGRQEGQEEYATGIIDTIEYIELIIAKFEKETDYTFDTSKLAKPALMERAEKCLPSAQRVDVKGGKTDEPA